MCIVDVHIQIQYDRKFKTPAFCECNAEQQTFEMRFTQLFECHLNDTSVMHLKLSENAECDERLDFSKRKELHIK